MSRCGNALLPDTNQDSAFCSLFLQITFLNISLPMMRNTYTPIGPVWRPFPLSVRVLVRPSLKFSHLVYDFGYTLSMATMVAPASTFTMQLIREPMQNSTKIAL